MKWIDKLTESGTRHLAHVTSRRSALSRIGTLLAGGMALPLLPVARASEKTPATGVEDPGDPTSCDYWRYCAIDGFLCTCCGGSVNRCPPGTEMSPITWIGTCLNPGDNRRYIISYNDCCGKQSCGNCLCNRNEGDRPMYRPDKNNDLNWCLGTSSAAYHCSTAVIIGLALEPEAAAKP